MNNQIYKYPRTRHIEGSRLQIGDEDLSQIPFKSILGKHIVIEEKVDGANTAISFDENGELLLQSRGHYLTGGYRERHYDLLKQWASIHQNQFFSVLGTRYVMYGEWLYAKHSVYYDLLPHYFLEFDVFDKMDNAFLSTKRRQELLKDLPVVSVKVLGEGVFNNPSDILKFLGNSNYISTSHLENLKISASDAKVNVEQCLKETDNSLLMEGLYIKVEENGEVVNRMKYVRYSFLQTVEESGSHWLDRPIIPNKLIYDINELFKVIK